MLSVGEPAEEAKCEDLVKVTIGDDPEKFFQSDPSYLNKREKS